MRKLEIFTRKNTLLVLLLLGFTIQMVSAPASAISGNSTSEKSTASKNSPITGISSHMPYLDVNNNPFTEMSTTQVIGLIVGILLLVIVVAICMYVFSDHS